MQESFRLSKEHEQFCSFMKCPLCKQFPIIPNYFKHNSTSIPRSTAISKMDRSATAECPKCKQRWNVFANTHSNAANQINKHQLLRNKRADVKLDAPLKVQRIELIETERLEEPMGNEGRSIDNLQGTGRVTRKLTISKEWSKTYTIDFEKAVKAHGGISFDLLKVINLKATIEGDLKKRYSISTNIKNAYIDEVSVEIEPRSKVLYLFKWKRIWQKGIAKCFDRFDREFANIPFQVVVGITFDIAAS